MSVSNDAKNFKDLLTASPFDQRLNVAAVAVFTLAAVLVVEFAFPKYVLFLCLRVCAYFVNLALCGLSKQYKVNRYMVNEKM